MARLNLPSLIVRGLAAALDLVLPPRCPVCRVIVADDGRFCAACWPTLTFLTAPCCAACGTPFDTDRGPAARCGACLLKPPRYTAARAAFAYDGAARAVTLAFKLADRQHLARPMAAHMARAGAAWFGPEALLVPVPLHRWRLWARTFNQSALLARELSKRTATPLAVDAMSRVRATRRSTGLGRRARAANVREAFRVARPVVVKGRAIILVDDVLTTGATAQACARALQRAGASTVHVLTFARVVRDGR